MVNLLNESPHWLNVVSLDFDTDYPGDFIDAEPGSSGRMGLGFIQGSVTVALGSAMLPFG